MGLKIKEFLDTEMITFATYKTVQQIPNLMDNLSQTQRKLIHVLQSRPNKKVKTAEVFTMIYNETKYKHGDVSAYNTAENMAAPFNNNINLLKPEGTFGYRTVTEASSPRYTNIIFGKVSQLIFNKRDIPLLEKQYAEGKEIEPFNLLPIVPLSLINGASGIAVGFASSICPRHPNQIIDILIKLLTGKTKVIPNNLPVSYPFFNGDIYTGETDKQFIVAGKISQHSKKNTLEITEVPIGKDRAHMIKLLNTLKDNGKIRSFFEDCKKNSFNFLVKVEENIYNLPNDKLLEYFKLTSKVSDNIVFLNRENEQYSINTFETVSDFLRVWIPKRLQFYKLRLRHELKVLEEDILKFQEQIRFIKLVNDNHIIINKQSRQKILDQIINFEFAEYNESFDYLLKMPIYNLSSEQSIILNDRLNNAIAEFEEKKLITPASVWVEELRELKKEIKKEISVKY